MLEVHPIHGPDEGGREQDRRPRGDLLDLLVLGQARLREDLGLFVLPLTDQRGVHQQDVLQQLAEALDAVHDLLDVVLDVTQRALQLGVDAVLVEPGRQAVQDRPQRRRGPLELDHLARELVDAPAHGGIPAEDLGLDLVDVVAQTGHHRRVVVHDPVENRVEHGLRAQGQELGVGLHPPAHARQVRRLTVPDGEDEVIADEHVQLREVDLLAPVVVPRRAQHDEQRLAVPLELGPLMRLHRVLDRELVQVELRRQGRQVRLVRADEPDPGQVAGVRVASFAQQRVGRRERARLREPDAVVVHDVDGDARPRDVVGLGDGGARVDARAPGRVERVREGRVPWGRTDDPLHAQLLGAQGPLAGRPRDGPTPRDGDPGRVRSAQPWGVINISPVRATSPDIRGEPVRPYANRALSGRRTRNPRSTRPTRATRTMPRS